MSVTMSDGRTQELTAPESGLATLTLKDGTEYGFRPTIQDSSPWNRIVVTIFRSATTSAPATILRRDRTQVTLCFRRDRDNFRDSFGDSGVPATQTLAYT
jgi:hypothetical protein